MPMVAAWVAVALYDPSTLLIAISSTLWAPYVFHYLLWLNAIIPVGSPACHPKCCLVSFFYWAFKWATRLFIFDVDAL